MYIIKTVGTSGGPCILSGTVPIFNDHMPDIDFPQKSHN